MNVAGVCYTCGQELKAGVTAPLRTDVRPTPVICTPCASIVQEIGEAFGEAFARVARLIRRGGAL